MKLSAALAILPDLFLALQAVLLPTARAVFNSPSLLFRPFTISRMLMANVWELFADSVDQSGRSVKQVLITRNAQGVVLDVGAGHGHTVNYLDPQKVTKYIALEPNTLMHPKIRAMANAAGFDESSGTLLILSSGAEQTSSIISGLDGNRHSVDTLISILTLCSVPSPQRTIRSLVDAVLKPGGQFLFYEHVRSDREDVVWWQRLWTPLWKTFFDGCCLDRPTHLWIQEMGMDLGGGEGVWKEGEIWGKEAESPENLFTHRVGWFVKSIPLNQG